MSDILERLRGYNPPDRVITAKWTKVTNDIHEAADEIERLREWDRKRQEDIMTLGQEIARLQAALKEALDFIESDGCGGNVLVQRLRPLTEEKSPDLATGAGVRR